jgi:hypothetical protein
MGPDRPRRRIRLSLSNLMLLVVIAALSTYIVVERWQRAQEERRLAAEARAALLRAEVQEALARGQIRGASPAARAGTSPAADKSNGRIPG